MTAYAFLMVGQDSKKQMEKGKREDGWVKQRSGGKEARVLTFVDLGADDHSGRDQLGGVTVAENAVKLLCQTPERREKACEPHTSRGQCRHTPAGPNIHLTPVKMTPHAISLCLSHT